MESVWWVFKQLYDKGLIYQGYRIQPYSPALATSLSNFEVNQGYRDRQDSFRNLDVSAPGSGSGGGSRDGQGHGRERPGLDHHALDPAAATWPSPSTRSSTMPSSRREGKKYWTPRRAAGPTSASARCWKTRKGAELAGRRYLPPFEYAPVMSPRQYTLMLRRLRERRGRHRGRALAPSFGEEDFQLGQKEGLGLFDPLDADGKFTELVRAGRAWAPRTRTRTSSTTSRRTAASSSTRPWCTAIPIAGAPTCPAVPGPEELVPGPRQAGDLGRRRDEDPQGVDDPLQPADQLGAGSHQGRPLRQVAGGRPRLEPQPQPLLGHLHPGLGGRRRRHDLRGLGGGAGGPDGREGPPTCTSTWWTRWSSHSDKTFDPPARPTAARRRCSTAGSSAGPCPMPRPIIPSRREGGSSALPAGLHRRGPGPDPRVVLHPDRAGGRAVRPAVVPVLRGHGIVLGDDGSARCPSRGATTRT